MKFIFIFLCVFLQLSLSGCSDGNADKKNELAIQTQLSTLQKQVSSINKQLNDQRESFKLMATMNDITVPQYSVGVFDTNSKDYQVITTESGDAKFLVALKKITKYVDGYKFEFAIGNPSSATYHGLKIKAQWGNNSNETTDPNSVLPNQWNDVTIILSPATATDVSNVTIALSVGTVGLLVDNRKSE